LQGISKLPGAAAERLAADAEDDSPKAPTATAKGESEPVELAPEDSE
jgi:hypothetical protein